MASQNIVPCYEYHYNGAFPEPESYLHYFATASAIAEQANARLKTLRELGTERILHRQIIGWSANLGSYGMGGPGFFGLKLSATELFSEEWLVLTLWGADNWLVLDNHWLAANPNQYEIQKPLYSNFGAELDWDETTPLLIGATLTDAIVQDNSSVLTLQRENAAHVLEIPQDPSRLSRYGGSGEPRVWNQDESQWDAWVVISGHAELLC